MAKVSKPNAEEHLKRVRRLCLALPGSWEKLSHGEPTFFMGKRVFAMFSNNHHNDGHLAIWLPATPGAQEELVQTEPKKFFRPAYVGAKGWIGVELPAIDDEELSLHIHEAWRIVNAKTRSGKTGRLPAT